MEATMASIEVFVKGQAQHVFVTLDRVPSPGEYVKWPNGLYKSGLHDAAGEPPYPPGHHLRRLRRGRLARRVVAIGAAALTPAGGGR